MKKFLAWRFFLGVVLVFLAVGITTYTSKRVFATGSFTVSNVTFDPTTGILTFDYTGTYDNGPASILQNGGSGTNLWGGSTAVCASGSCTIKVNPSVSLSLDSGITSVTIHDNSGDVSQALNYPLPYATTNSPLHAYTSVVNGWVQDGNTWTYDSADSPTFTATASGDLTGVYSPGMRVKLTQSSTTEYFLITGVSYSSPNTTITLYGGTDYTLANSAISNVYFSGQKAPVGFPLDPNKWTVQVSDNTAVYTTNPTSGTWYNADQISIPIGIWNVNYQSAVGGYANGLIHTLATLSTANNTESDSDFTAGGTIYSASTVDDGEGFTVNRTKTLNLSSKTTYYLNYEAVTGGAVQAGLYGNWSKTIIRAVSAYL